MISIARDSTPTEGAMRGVISFDIAPDSERGTMSDSDLVAATRIRVEARLTKKIASSSSNSRHLASVATPPALTKTRFSSRSKFDADGTNDSKIRYCEEIVLDDISNMGKARLPRRYKPSSYFRP